MKRSFKNLFMIIVILVTSIVSSMRVAPANALGSLIIVPGLPTELPTPPGETSPLLTAYLYGTWGADSSHIFSVGYGNTGGGGLAKPVIYQTTNGTNWTATSPALPTSFGEDWQTGLLYSTWGISSTNVYAAGVGGRSALTLPLLYHTTDGINWTSSSPALPNSNWNAGEVHGMWGAGASDVYLVGFGSGTTFQNYPVVFHWNGSAWSSSNPGLPTGYTHAYLNDIWGSGSSNVYVAGYGQNASSNNMPLLYHWNGTIWEKIAPALPAGWVWGKLNGIWGSSATDIYAVGNGQNGSGANSPLMYHWNGSTWSPVTPDLPTTDWGWASLQAVWGASSSEVYAVGFGYNVGASMTMPVLYRKTSNGWVASTYAFSGWTDGFFYDLWGFGSDNLYVVGYGQKGEYQPIVAHGALDTIAPGAVTSLTATEGVDYGSVDLSWIAPPDDAGSPNSGAVNSYLVKYSDTISFTDCNGGTEVTSGLPTPVVPGAPQTMTVSGLTAGVTYNFAVCAWDEDGNLGPYATASAVAQTILTRVYDDSDPGWTYNGSFVIFSSPSAYNGGIRYTTTLGNYAQFTFTGSQFILYYTGGANRGLVDIFVDGSPTKYATINEYTATASFQKKWSSANLGSGTHTVKLKYAGPSGTMVNIDAIETGLYQPPGGGMYDDSYPGWTYNGTFTAFASTSAYQGGIHYTTTIGDYAQFEFTGSQFSILYTGNTNRGLVNVYVDGNPSLYAQINEYTSTAVFQKKWTSGDLGAGSHTVKLVHGGAAGTNINIDAIEIKAYDPPPGVGVYDDSDTHWKYTGAFTIYTSASAYNGGIRYTTTVGNYAEFTFLGSQFILYYTGGANRGKVDVFLDGSPAKTATINEYTSSPVFQKKWASGDLGAGTHTVKLVHGGATGTMVNFDAIEIATYTPPVPVGAGTYNDDHANWNYSGNFIVYTSASAYQGGIRYTTTVGDYAEFTSFTGSQISILYTGGANRGLVDVYIDGSPTKYATFNEYTASAVYQKTWTSGNLGSGTHTVKLVHAGASGTMINIDAIEVGTYSPPGVGIYDDTDGGWVYTGTFTVYASASAYDGGIHYTTTPGYYAEFTFTGSQITIFYTGNTNRGTAAVYLDGSGTPIGTMDQYTASLAYQQTWTIAVTPGQHTVKIVHTGSSGETVNIDAIQIQ